MRKAPLTYNRIANQPADHDELRVRFNGVAGPASEWIEVDTLGMWGVRPLRDKSGAVMKDDDDCDHSEKVYGRFELSYVPEFPGKTIEDCKEKFPGLEGWAKDMDFSQIEGRALAYHRGGTVTGRMHRQNTPNGGEHVYMTSNPPDSGDIYRTVARKLMHTALYKLPFGAQVEIDPIDKKGIGEAQAYVGRWAGTWDANRVSYGMWDVVEHNGLHFVNVHQRNASEPRDNGDRSWRRLRSVVPTGGMLSKPPLEDLAALNIRHYGKAPELAMGYGMGKTKLTATQQMDSQSRYRNDVMTYLHQTLPDAVAHKAEMISEIDPTVIQDYYDRGVSPTDAGLSILSNMLYAFNHYIADAKKPRRPKTVQEFVDLYSMMGKHAGKTFYSGRMADMLHQARTHVPDVHITVKGTDKIMDDLKRVMETTPDWAKPQ